MYTAQCKELKPSPIICKNTDNNTKLFGEKSGSGTLLRGITITNYYCYFCLKEFNMDIQTEKIELAKLLLTTNNPEIIESFKQILNKDKSIDLWGQLSSQEQEEIKNASLEIEEGKVTD